ncbi:conserved hypothetical protein [Methylocella tundrae]|uniref:DUF218 domain-containing protein n=1 Tax=Methylocella tundrae TaxID=227605 RepID=A0A8B6M2N6_METTU|nr:YdcF family protein [Methylocella tundrae]VTZ22373.1 conserved hypothetical protein [Methylocella tundrae]VTZ49096.1 conserved hypothetical protein [Methylocella tundrae]
MFFALSKIFWLIAEPLTFLLILLCIGVALQFTRRARLGRRWTAATTLALAVLLLTPLSAALLLPLENRFPAPSADLAPPTGIIVLGGALQQRKSESRGQVILSEDGARLIAGLELARRYPQARLIYSGGSGDLLDQSSAETVGARKFWLALGGPADRMSFESRSRNTWENALFTRDLLQPKPGETWLLVTSAWHMPRSMGIFRRLGFDVIAYPVAYRTFGDARDWSWFASASDRIPMLDLSVREWIGLLAYRLTGKTGALFPAP